MANQLKPAPRHVAGVVVAGAVFAGLLGEARALSCIVPAGGRAHDTDVLITCSVCNADDPALTALTDATSSERIEIDEVDRAGLVGGGVSVRYRASEPLRAERYLAQASNVTLTVVSMPEQGVPQVPLARLVGYRMEDTEWGPVRLARFELEGVNGSLVADVGDPERDPMENLQYTWQDASMVDLEFGLGVDLCSTSFAEADYDVKTTVRFGTMAPNGDFSGFGEWLEVRYPDELGQFEFTTAGELVPVGPPPPLGEPTASDASVPPVGDGGDVDLDRGIARNPVDTSPERYGACSLGAPSVATSTLGWGFVMVGFLLRRRLRR
jgi:hypothetical protein